MMAEEHDLLAAYALDALDELERRRFELHLDECEQCRHELAELLTATTFLADLSAEPAPAQLRQKVLAQVAAPKNRRSAAWLVAAAAAVLALVFGGLWAMSQARLDEVQQIAAVYQATDAQPAVLTGAEGEGVFTFSATLRRGVFITHDLEAAPAESVYELWLIDDEGPHPAGLFEAGEPILVEGVVPGQVIAVTLEPAGGSELPTGEVLLSAEL
jgi:anti-sigma-K factor RskA